MQFSESDIEEALQDILEFMQTQETLNKSNQFNFNSIHKSIRDLPATKDVQLLQEQVKELQELIRNAVSLDAFLDLNEQFRQAISILQSQVLAALNPETKGTYVNVFLQDIHLVKFFLDYKKIGRGNATVVYQKMMNPDVNRIEIIKFSIIIPKECIIYETIYSLQEFKELKRVQAIKAMNGIPEKHLVSFESLIDYLIETTDAFPGYIS